MKASSKKVLTTFSVAGLTLAFAVGCALQLHAQTDNPSGGSFNAPLTTSLTHAHEALLKARQALATGDVETARQLVETARTLPLDATLSSDTPTQVEALINRHIEITEIHSSGDLNAYNRSAAVFLLQQAEGLIGYREFTTAQSLISLVRDFDVQFEPGQLSPEHLQARLQQAKSIAGQAPSGGSAMEQAGRILSQAQLAFDQGELDLAEQLVAQVKAFNLQDNAFEDGSILPWELELQISQARQRQETIAQAGFDNNGGTVVQQADYYPELDTTRNMQVGGTEANDGEGDRFNDARGRRLYDSGISALTHDDSAGALEYFRMAWQYRDQLDPATRQDLQEKLTQLQISADAEAEQPEQATDNPMNASFDEVEQVSGVDEDLRRQMFSDVLRQRAVAERMVEQRNPRGALNHMRLVRDNIHNSDLDGASKTQLVAVVEREIAEMERFIEQNLGEIENDEMNRQRRQDVDLDRQNRDDVERKIQALVNDFNRLVDEQRFEEAEYLARQANELAPDLEVVQLMVERSKLMANDAAYERIRDQKADDFTDAMLRGDEAMTIPVWEDEPLSMNPDRWEEIAQTRNSNLGQGGYASERERVIWSALKNQTIQAEFNRTPLSEAIQILAERAGVNMIFDSRALEVENVGIDQPITMSFPQPITIESALNIILGDNGLVFKVESEVVKITNKQALQANPVPQTYYVGDLIMPVPDFSGNPINIQFLGGPNNQGMQFNPGMNNFGSTQQGAVQPVSYNQQMPNDSFGFGAGPTWSGAAVPHTSGPKYNRWGPKDVGGGITEQDFDQLMDLIQETIDPDSWEENGGTGRMRPFPATLSLIITQTQENQDRIQNLLTRLRELNDVQIVVEVRFIRLRDDFFERVGIDFDFQFNDNTGLTATTLPDNTSNGFGGTAIVGRAPIADAFIPTADLDIPVFQNGFGSAIPQFGGFDPGSALNFGFAILSDIEVFFLLQAAKGDERSNVTQAPTVTMFNGQSASVFDGSQQPFVTSIQPVVGDFAAAQQPIITILPTGTQLNVRAVASADRRFVRMTLVPFFSQVTDVQEFTFDGTRSVRRGGGTDLEDILDAIGGNPGDPLGNDEIEITESGTTVQLPVFANTTITTTVSVPDGGTVLLGGIKEMSETRVERGVPFLSNVPYVNRLFKNVGIGRETNSLMMMVTPRIIIQEEEEARQINVGN